MAKKKDFNAAAAENMSSAEIAEYLSEREQKFVQEMNRCLNGTQAAISAGYAAGKGNSSAAVTACRLLRDPRVKAYRQALIRESVEEMALCKDSIVLKLLEIYQRCMTAVPVLVYDKDAKDWVESGEWRFDSKGATRAIEQISKILGYDAPMKLADPNGEPLSFCLGGKLDNDGG